MGKIVKGEATISANKFQMSVWSQFGFYCKILNCLACLNKS